MDEIEKRLREGADNCIKFYEGWRSNEKDSRAREQLLEAVHELRKVAARMEIEMAISERDEMAARPIPIPPHRASHKRHGGGMDDDSNDNAGNREQPSGPPPGGSRKPQRGGGGPRRKSSQQGD